MAARPPLYIGDLVKFNRKYQGYREYFGKIFRVVAIRMERSERRKLGLRSISSSDGACNVMLIDRGGFSTTVKRRFLWRIPDQPRFRKKSA